MSKRILIIGATGMLGQALVKIGKDLGYLITGASINNSKIKLDVTNDDQLADLFKKNIFDIVINTASFVNHEFCEKNPLEAYKLNARPSAILTMLAKKHNFKYVYISTDGYYNNDFKQIHHENFNIEFYNEYARTKYAGECYTLANPNSLVIRTNITGFKGDTNNLTFFEWILNSFKNNKHISMFDDYYTSTISTTQFSKALYRILEKNVNGVLNIASSEVFSKKDFIEEVAKQFGFSLNNTSISSVKTLQSSKRANSLGLDVSKAENILGYKLPCLKDVIGELKNEYEQMEK